MPSRSTAPEIARRPAAAAANRGSNRSPWCIRILSQQTWISGEDPGHRRAALSRRHPSGIVDKIVGVNTNGMSLAGYMGRRSAPSMRLISLLVMVSSLASAGESGYLGRDVCVGCHKDIAIMQSRTNMARAWRGIATPQLPANYSETNAEGPAPAIEYALARTGRTMQYRGQMPGRPPPAFPV